MKNILLPAIVLLATTSSVLAQRIETAVPYKVIKSTKKVMQESKKVAIGYFGVSQTTQNSASSTAAGGGAFAKMTVNFGGVDIAAYQKILQEGYNLAVKKLTALGYQVVKPEELAATGEETYVPAESPEEYCAQSNTIRSVNIQPRVTQLTMDMTPLGSNPFMKKAKAVDAHLLNFVFGATAVSYDRGSRLGKKASVSGAPYLTFGGALNVYPVGKGGSPFSITAGSKEGVEDIAGPEGISETSKNSKPWMGSNMGKYVLQVDEAKYLAAMRAFLNEAVEDCIARMQEEVKE